MTDFDSFPQHRYWALGLGAALVFTACGVDTHDPLVDERSDHEREIDADSFPVVLNLNAGWSQTDWIDLHAGTSSSADVPYYSEEEGGIVSPPAAGDLTLSVGRYYGLFGAVTCGLGDAVGSVDVIDVASVLESCSWGALSLGLSGEPAGVIANQALLLRDRDRTHVTPARVIAAGWSEGAFMDLEIGAPQPFDTRGDES